MNKSIYIEYSDLFLISTYNDVMLRNNMYLGGTMSALENHDILKFDEMQQYLLYNNVPISLAQIDSIYHSLLL